jgi:hypothetical protein
MPFDPTMASCYAFEPRASAKCQPEFNDRSYYTKVERGNYQGLYPPLYYATMRTFIGDDFDDSVMRIRVINSVVAIGVIGLLAAMIPASLRRPLLWGFMGACVPLGLFVLGSINPSAWAILSAGTLWIAYYAAFAAAGWRRWGLAAFTFLVMLMGSGARGDSCLFACLAIVVVFILRWGMLRSNLGMSLLGGAMVAVSAALFLSSNQSDVATSGLAAAPDLLSRSSPVALTIDNLLSLPELLTGMFGSTGLGWLDTPTEPIVFFSAVSVFIVLVFVGLTLVTVRKLLAVALVASALIVFPLAVLVQSKQVVGQTVQPRYLIPLVVMLIGVSVFPAARHRGGVTLSRPQVAIVVVALSVAQSVALHANIRRYVTGMDVDGLNLDASTEWWWDLPVSPMAVWIVGSVAFALLSMVVFTMSADDETDRTVTAHDRQKVGSHREPTEAGEADANARDAGTSPRTTQVQGAGATSGQR